eukprot:scaffold17583_cov92-Phaeocystis_antarctica.AAC.3
MGWTTTRGALKGKSKIPVSKRDKTSLTGIYFSANRQISGDREDGSSLIFAKNSGRKFQTHISNSGEQIPKHARQNSEDCRFPVSRNKVRSRGHRFLGTDFPILVSEFKFPPRSSNLGRLTLLISRFSMQIHGRPRPGDRTIPVSDFTVHNSGFKKALAHRKPAGSSFPIYRFWFQRSPPFM